MAERMENSLEKLFEAARKEPLVASFEEIRLNFEMHAGAAPSFPGGWKQFFTHKINLLYVFLGAALVTALVLIDFDMNKKQKRSTPEMIEEHVILPGKQEELPLEETIEKEDTLPVGTQERISAPAAGKEMPSQRTEQTTPSHKKNLPSPEIAVEQAEKQVPVPEKTVKKEKEPEEKKPAAVEQEKKQEKEKPARPRVNVKPPFKYTFTPATPEAELRQLQKDLAKENVKLEFSKLKYKDGKIEKIEGTIEIDGYAGRFTTDEFEDFTFAWSFSRYKGSTPEKFDIIINTPMQKRSNTEVHIDELE